MFNRVFIVVCLLASLILQLTDNDLSSLWWLGLAIFGNVTDSKEYR